ncbi:MAG TPA: Arm DNA-binding domain-containing protein, partial [Cyclobacteriaceae bacterium]|nr:Arm DNA-binding domain-containing protein [Cyclobacteriaceae bacterium]
MGYNFKSILNRNNQRNKKGFYSITIRASINRRTDYLSLKDFPRIQERHWSKLKSRIQETFPNAFKLNKILSDHISDLNSYVIDQLEKRRPVTMEKVKDYFYHKKQRESFNKFIAAEIPKRRLGYLTIKAYKTFQRHFNAFNPSVS